MVTKKCESQGDITQSQYEIMQGIANFLTVKQIAKYRGVSRQSIYKVINKLKKKGFINIHGGLTHIGIGGLSSFIGFRNKKRYHNIAYKIEIKEKSRNWDQKRSSFTLLSAWNKRVDLKNTYYDLFSMGNVKIKTTTRSIILYLPAIYGDTVEDCVVRSMDMLFDKLPEVENLFKIRLIKNKTANITLISQECARLQDAFARIYSSEGKKLQVKDAKGNVWLLIDMSYNVNELETVSNKSADEDMVIVDTFYNDLRRNPTTFGEVLDVVNGIVKNQAIFDANMKSHIEAVKQLGRAVNLLTEKIEKFK